MKTSAAFCFVLLAGDYLELWERPMLCNENGYHRNEQANAQKLESCVIENRISFDYNQVIRNEENA